MVPNSLPARTLERALFIDADSPSNKITFGHFLSKVHSTAFFLNSIGFSSGDVACVVLPNCWHFFAVFLGASMQKGCISPVNALLSEAELVRTFNETKCKVVFCVDSLLDRILATRPHCPHLKHIVLISIGQFPAKSMPNLSTESVVQWSDAIDSAAPVDFSRPLPKIEVEKDVMFMPFSSGTTGLPKGVMLTHRNVGTIHLENQMLKKMEPDWDWKKEHIMLHLPFYHVYGFILGVNSLLRGGSGVTFGRFDLDIFCRTIQNYKIKVAFLVPPILVLLAKAPAVSRYDLSSLQLIMTGAAPQICQGYGMTEQTVVDIESRRSLGVGQKGEICTRSPTTMLGYLNRDEATAEIIDKDGWLKTGDIGYFDENGCTYVVDRLKELIKVKGFQVAPAELEDLLLSHVGVKDCAVVGVLDELAGEVPKAFVVKADQKLTETELKHFVREKVASYKQLSTVEFVDEIPKSASGKILRRLLREKSAKRHSSS
uniref:4-coumarate--CoA ligase n=1 Tax=Globodera pallida TaxID=36090 RepID=A0A183C2K0_GLOPA